MEGEHGKSVKKCYIGRKDAKPFGINVVSVGVDADISSKV
jgi:hypothetical protein